MTIINLYYENCRVTNLFSSVLVYCLVLFDARQLLEDGESSRRQMQEKICDLVRRLSRDVAASRDVESLRAEVQAAKTKIDQLQMDDHHVQ